MKLADQPFPVASVTPAHPLFPPDQVFLWLPGFPGEELPFCSYNEARNSHLGADGSRSRRAPTRDSNGAYFSPPCPISPQSFILWQNQVSPPFPFHAVPLKRSLSVEEMKELARQVAQVTGCQSDDSPSRLGVIRNDFKAYILSILSRMGVLAGIIPHRR